MSLSCVILVFLDQHVHFKVATLKIKYFDLSEYK